MSRKTIPRLDLPAGLRPDTLAVREGLPPRQWGENSEALFLTSSFVHPDAATAAARFANEEEAFVYSRFSQPDGDDDRAPARRAGRHGGLHRHRQRHGRDHCCSVLSLLKAGDHLICSQSVFGSTIKLFAGVRQVRHRDQLRLADRRRRNGARAMRPEHEAAVRRDAEQPADRGLRHRGAGRDRA